MSQWAGALVASVGVATRHSGGTALGCIGLGFAFGGINGAVDGPGAGSLSGIGRDPVGRGLDAGPISGGGGAVGAGGVMFGAVGGGVGATWADAAAAAQQQARMR